MSVKQSILFGLTLLDTILGEFRDPGGFVSFGYENLYGFVPKSYKRNSLYAATRSLRHDESITAISRGKFQLTKRGRAFVLDSFPLLKFVNKPWDGKWRLVGFDIQEEQRSQRNNLRKFLYQCGFGMLQESLYISPLPIEEDLAKFFATHRTFLSNTYIFVSETFFLDDRVNFVERIFKVNKLSNEYKALLERVEKGIGKEEQSQLLREFFEVSRRDPFLPQELLPEDFPRSKVLAALGES